MENYFTFNTAEGKCKGAFNIYQGKDGAIYILIATKPIKLNKEQVNELPVSLYEIDSFSQDAFNSYYQ